MSVKSLFCKILFRVSKIGTYANISVTRTWSYVPVVLFLLLSNLVPSTFWTGSTSPHFSLRCLFSFASEFKGVNGFSKVWKDCSILFLFSVSCGDKHCKATSLAWLWISKITSSIDETNLLTLDWLNPTALSCAIAVAHISKVLLVDSANEVDAVAVSSTLAITSSPVSPRSALLILTWLSTCWSTLSVCLVFKCFLNPEKVPSTRPHPVWAHWRRRFFPSK